ncbi:c-type cytochrome [Shewanella sedimentimangrovi]|uniref:Cytochrome c n=1 Tax=Shewanella sedimentimangrovi TaxID=2814293 RepID=A0ABX7R3I5_9GAMM|nr:cytochrome c [Shewanella sedimentimangrovi]QSX37721.1 cytochrome c [Shewanella sedimentimangrovi]
MNKQLLFAIFCLSSFSAAANNNGADLYQRHCAQCHGSDGEPVMPGAANFNLQQGLNQSPKALALRIENGKRSCPPFAGILNEQQLYDLVSHLRKMGR